MVFLSFLISTLYGFSLVGCLWPNQPPFKSWFFVKLFIAFGLGIGITSCLLFLFLITFGSLTSQYFILEILILLLFVSAFLYKTKTFTQKMPSVTFGKSDSKSNLRWLFSILFLALFGTSIFVFISLSLQYPHGRYDAWMMYNLRAKFLFNDSIHWAQAFTEYFTNPDYPLLLSASIVRSWMYIGIDKIFGPALLSMLFTFATVGLLVSSLSILQNGSQGLLAGLILLSTPLFLERGAAQDADVPLGFFFLSTFVLLTFGQVQPRKNAFLMILAGITGGFSAWTKNEGLLFLIALATALLAIVALSRKRVIYLNQLRLLVLGAFPILLLILYYKTQMVPPDFMVASQSREVILAKITDGSRHFLVFKTFLNEIFHFGKWTVSIPALLFFYMLILGVSIKNRHKVAIFTIPITLSMTLIGYYLVFVISPLPLDHHLHFTLCRLLIQLWPSFLLMFFLLVRTPEYAITKCESRAMK